MILGQGNVALDVARILLTPPEQLEVSGQVRGRRGEEEAPACRLRAQPSTLSLLPLVQLPITLSTLWA